MIRHTLWNGIEALTIENDAVSCTVLPSPGGKIVSIFDRRRNREWLVPPMREVRESPYGSGFTDGCMCGWDEMLPTIDECEWNGICLPDHGELWGTAWETIPDDDAIILRAAGKQTGLILRRSICPADGNTLRFDYRLENSGDAPIPWLWAAHPQFAADENVRIVLPEGTDRVINVLDDDPLLGKAGRVSGWPDGSPDAGIPLDRIRSARHRSCRKYYIPPYSRIDHAALADEKTGSILQLRWDANLIPYCGIWIDEGCYHSHPVAAIEPASAYYDSLKRALDNGTAPFIEGKQTVSWQMRVSIL